MAARATDAEEQELRRLLRSGEVPESLRDLAALFEGLGALSGERMPDTGAAGRPAADSSCRKLPRTGFTEWQNTQNPYAIITKNTKNEVRVYGKTASKKCKADRERQ